MIYVDVKTIWHGQVGIHAKYLNHANNKKENLTITCKGQEMVIKWEELSEKVSGKSEHKFHDKHGGKDYYLYYFKWVPKKVKEVKVENPDPHTLELF